MSALVFTAAAAAAAATTTYLLLLLLLLLVVAAAAAVVTAAAAVIVVVVVTVVVVVVVAVVVVAFVVVAEVRTWMPRSFHSLRRTNTSLKHSTPAAMRLHEIRAIRSSNSTIISTSTRTILYSNEYSCACTRYATPESWVTHQARSRLGSIRLD